MKQVNIIVSGHDHVGIVANVSQELAKFGLNIVDISQTVMSEHFTMVLVVDLDGGSISYEELAETMKDLAGQLKLSIRITRR